MKKFIIGFLVFALVAISTVFAIAQKGGDSWKGKRAFGHRGGFGRMAEKLNLTDAQKTQIKEITDASRAKIKPLMETMRANHQKMNEATANGQFDEARVSAIAQEQAQISAQLIVEKERVKAQMFQVLTTEQQAQAKAFREQMKEKMKERFEKRKQMKSQSDDAM